MYYAPYIPVLLHFTEYASVLSLPYVNQLSVIIAFLQSFSLSCSFHLESFSLLFIIFFSIVFSDGKVSFSQYLLTRDKVKLLKGKNAVAEESVFQLLPSSREKNSELPSYQNFLTFGELDERLELAYELAIRGKKISTRFYIFTRGSVSEEELDAKVRSILSSFNLNTDYVRMRYDVLEDAFLDMIGGEYFNKIRKIKSEKNVLLLETEGSATYAAIIALKGSPDYESLDPGCVDLFVNSIQNLDVDISFVVPFRFVRASDSEYTLKKDLKVRIQVNGKLPVKYLEASPYLVVRGPSLESVKNHAKRVCVAASAAWSGIKKRVSVNFLDSDEAMKFLHRIICRRLLPERELLRIQNLGIYLRIPQSVGGTVKPPTMISNREIKIRNSENNRILLGKTTLSGRSVPVWMDYDDFSKPLVIFGDSDRKTCFLSSLLKKISKPWIVLDFKGEFCKLKDLYGDSVSFFTPNSDSEPLRINLFDPKEKSPDEHASFLLSVFEKIFENDFDILEKPLRRILSYFCSMDRYKQGLMNLNKAFDEILEWKNSQKQSVIRELVAMLHSLQHGVLGNVFASGDSNPDLGKLTDERLVINLTRIMSEADISEVKFLLTYIIMSLFNNLTNDKNGIKHITVINSPENNSELINFLSKVIFDKSTILNTGGGLILTALHPQDFNGRFNSDSCYKIIFDSVREAENTDELTGIKSEKIEITGEEALMIIPGAENPVILYPDYDKSVAIKEKPSSQLYVDHTKRKLKTPAISKKPKAEIRDNLDSENPYSLSKDDFITADQLFRGFRNPNKTPSKLSYNLSREQILAFVDKISRVLESEVYLTDIYISRVTGLPPKTVNKIILEALDTDLEIQRIYVPVVGNKANVPLYYSKSGLKYESVQDKYLKDNLEEWCFKKGINWTVKRDPETGADGQIDSHVLKLITHIPEDNELKNMFQKLFLKCNRVAVLFLHDKDLEEAESLNSQWRIPLIMGCLSNLNAFLTEIMEASTKKILSQTGTIEKDLQELISWLKTDT